MKKGSPKASPISGFKAKRSELINEIADALLAAGVAQISLRDLAAHLGTSDRMLLYYFKDKESLVEASLREVSSRLAAIFATELSTRKISPSKLLNKAIPLLASRAAAPFMTVWTDISARASRKEEPFCAMAHNSVRWWLEWLEARLDVADSEGRRDMAALILAALEGARLLEASVLGVSKGAIKILSRALDEARVT